MRFTRLPILVASTAIAMLVVAPPGHAAGLTEVTGFGTNPGNLQMFTYIPTGLPAGQPLVVALHGCTQSAAAYDDETGWTKWADTYGFALLLPQQKSSNNLNKCFNWFLTGDQARGSGEPLSVKQMVDWMQTTYGVDASRIFVTGLSAGGGFTSTMLATYPDVFSKGAVVAGMPYKCATTVGSGTSCTSGNVDKTPTQWGNLVRGASTWSGPWPHVSLWHGDADTTVSPFTMHESMEQWTNVNGVDQTADTTDTVGGYPHAVYKDGTGTPVVETYTITGMGHGQPIDPGTGATQCGVLTGYNLDANICASYWISKWFGVAP